MKPPPAPMRFTILNHIGEKGPSTIGEIAVGQSKADRKNLRHAASLARAVGLLTTLPGFSQQTRELTYALTTKGNAWLEKRERAAQEAAAAEAEAEPERRAS